MQSEIFFSKLQDGKGMLHEQYKSKNPELHTEVTGNVFLPYLYEKIVKI